MKRISATEASRRFSELLTRVKHGGESFIVERNGDPVAQIRPARRPSTVDDLLDFLATTPLPDSDFRGDMEEIIARSRSSYPRDPWSHPSG